MIEIKGISKTYHPKKGVPVKALDNVSLNFGDTGLVFILGKSGSGKSTLLNVLGGLDAYDSGEFIIKGKSSKNFKQSDFDAYRNTFIGFIFQEYNILNEFSVGANIALAMELQGRKATSESLNNILDQVDLSGYANRKPNELSGGQKQRVAIARALIKEPEIIMADEPTGALDSNTGKQVFETLKELAKTKLVIVVSHDREFAEFYGDRVIELADGKIISDISKYMAAPDKKSEGINIIDNKVIHVKKGYKLTAKDMELIHHHISSIDHDTLISIDAKVNTEIKRVSMISDDGNKKSFDSTDNKAVLANSKINKEFKLINARLPFKNSFKMGASSLKSKPIRLIFTILLSVIAFGLFGLADTMASYNKVNTTIQSIIDSGVKYASFQKGKQVGDEKYPYVEPVLLSKNDVNKIEQETGVKTKPVYSKIDSELYLGAYITNTTGLDGNSNYYTKSFSGIVEVDENELNNLGYTIVGRLPINDQEIAITKYTFEQFKIGGWKNGFSEGSIKPADISNEQSFLSNAAKPHINNMRIVGIVDTKFNASGEYDAFKPGASVGNEGIQDYLKMATMETELLYSYHSLAFAKQTYINKFFADNVKFGNVLNNQGSLYFSDYGYSTNTLATYQQAKENSLRIISSKTALEQGDVIVPYDSFKLYIADQLNNIDIILKQEDKFKNNYSIDDNGDLQKTTILWNDFNAFYSNAASFFSDNLIIDYFILNSAEIPNSAEFNNELLDRYNAECKVLIGSTHVPLTSLTAEQRAYSYKNYLNDKYYANPSYPVVVELKEKIIYNIFKKYNLNSVLNFNEINVNINSINADAFTKKVNVVGFHFSETFTNSSSKVLICDDEFYNSFEQTDLGSIYAFTIGIMPTVKADISKVVKFNYSEFGKASYQLKNKVSTSLSNINSLIEELSNIFLYIGIGFAVFASLLLMNFISTSISYKKREIGILRAVGAKSSDVFGIFFNESLIIAAINFVLALIASIAVCFFINKTFITQLGLPLTILNLGFRQVLLLLGVSIGVAFVASFLPVYNIAKKLPIDAIQNR